MASPSAIVRQAVYTRDGARCVSCGARSPLGFQHRRAVGMGGSKTRPAYEDGLTACHSCNSRYESDLQLAALKYGWKIPRWVLTPGFVPVWYSVERRWYRLSLVGTREAILPAEALQMMEDVYGPEIATNGGGYWREILKQ